MKKHLIVAMSVVASLAFVSPRAHAITNGQPDDSLHPYVGLLVFDDENGPAWRCSGALISPTVVLTAGHCTEGAVAARVWFDERVSGNPDYPAGGPSAFEGRPYTYPTFCFGCSHGLVGADRGDVGVVVLDEAVPASVVDTYGELPQAGLVSTLRNKTPVEVVGYGVQQQLHGGGPPVWTGPAVRLYAPTELLTVEYVQSEWLFRLAANPGGGSGGICFGDSGGPDLLDGTTTILGVNALLTNYNCAGTSYSTRIDTPEILAWIRSFLT